MCKNEEMLLLLSGHIDGCNTPEEDARLEAHVAACPDCRRILDAYKELDAGIADLSVQPPADFTANVMRAVESEPRKTEKPRRFTFGFATAVAAAAAVLLLVVGSGKLPQLRAAGAKICDSVMAPAAMKSAPTEEPEPEEAAAEAAIDLPEAAFSANDQIEESEKAVFQAEIIEIADGAMLVKPLGDCPEADYAPYVNVVIQNMAGSPEPRVGDVVEITYSGMMTEEDPPSPNGVSRIQVIQHNR